MARSTRAAERLQSLGLHVETFEPKTLADVHATLVRIAQLLGEPARGEAEWARIEREIAAVARGLPASVRGTTVYVEVDAGPYAASEASHVGELLTRLGVRNIVPASLGSVPRLNPEFVVRADPQVIVAPADAAAMLAARPGWQRIRAVRDGHICALPRTQSELVMRPGPRVAEGAALLAACLQAKAAPR
jgi:iron complex transport system substrate-binding protein